MEEMLVPGELEKLSGSVESVIYANEENGYGIMDFVLDGGDLVTIVGTLPYIGEGETLTVYGKWVHNPKYGTQFRVEQYEKIMPATETAILRYLSSGAIKGIGPKLAVRIVEKYGTETFDVIENHAEWLADISGISRKRAVEISEDFRMKSGMRSAMMAFGEYFGAATTVKIYGKWGSAAVDVVRKNPYILCRDIEGVGFEKADGFAKSVGVAADSPERICGGILHILSHNALQNGHTCLIYDKLIAASAALLKVSENEVAEALKILIEEKSAVLRVYDEEKFVYATQMYLAEKSIAKRMFLLDRNCIHADIREIHRFIEREEHESGLAYAELQRKAIIDAMSNGVTVLTGGPGTGKTTVVRALLHIFKSMGMKVCLAAPTGRAAKRLSESTGSEAKTLHRLLEFASEDGDKAVFLRNERNYLDENVVIVDEVSMADTVLMSALLKAIKPGARLILIGDDDQLPSVGAGNVLHDIIESGCFSVVRLKEVFRQAQESLIITNAHRINEGEMPVLDAKEGDFFFLARSSGNDIANTVVDLCLNRLPRAYGIEPLTSVQVITPTRRGEGGTDHLNMLLQNALNPPSKKKTEYIRQEKSFRVGDKVMQIRNNYEIEWEKDGQKGMGIFNGDMGEILYIDAKEKYMEIAFDERLVRYEFSMLDELEHSYAITVHKSQGSEYPYVIIPMFSAPPMLLTRNLLYTAVTRAQKMVILVGRSDVIGTMVSNNRHVLRYTGLSHLLLKEKARVTED